MYCCPISHRIQAYNTAGWFHIHHVDGGMESGGFGLLHNWSGEGWCSWFASRVRRGPDFFVVGHGCKWCVGSTGDRASDDVERRANERTSGGGEMREEERLCPQPGAKEVEGECGTQGWE